MMRLFLSILLSIFISTTFAQKLSYEDFIRETKFNKRLLPKEGSTTKSDDQLEAEKAYVEKMKQEYSSARKASNHLVQEGIDQLKEDPREAMYSFNNAYLVDSSNAKVYWGYGELYSNFKQYEISGKYYQEGLYRDGKAVYLLNSQAQNYLNKYEEEELPEYLESALELLEKSLKSSEENPETYLLLAKVYRKFDDCELAKDYLNNYLEFAGDAKDEEAIHSIKKGCE